MKKEILFLIFSFILLSPFTLAATLEQRTIGDPSAPVTIEIVIDSHIIGPWYFSVYPELKKNLIDSGKGKIIFHHKKIPTIDTGNVIFPTLEYAKAIECAAEQGKFEKYFYELQSEYTPNFGPDRNLISLTHPGDPKRYSKSEFKEFAIKLNLSLGNFLSCYDDPKTVEKINSNINYLSKQGPNIGILVNGRYISRDEDIVNQANRELLNLQTPPQDLQLEPVFGEGSELSFELFLNYGPVLQPYFWKGLKERILKGINNEDYSIKITYVPTERDDPDYALAQAGECILNYYGDESHFEYVNRVMESLIQKKGSFNEDKKDLLNEVLNNLNFNNEKINSCINEKKFLPEILHDISVAKQRGIVGDTIFLNGQEFNIVPADMATEDVLQQINEAIRQNIGNLKTKDLQPEPILGNKNSKVKVTAYIGSNDANSAQGWNNLMKAVNSLDNVNVEFRNLPFISHDQNYFGAQVNECVLSMSNDETFFRYLNKLFSDTSSWGTYGVDEAEASGGRAAFTAQLIGLNIDKIMDCVRDTKFLTEVLDDIRSSKKESIVSTPAYVINGDVFEGVFSPQDLTIMIKSATHNIPSTSETRTFNPIITQSSNGCLEGCDNNGKCIPKSFRITDNENLKKYCSKDNTLNLQKEIGSSCTYNYECTTNSCENSQCKLYEEKKEKFFEKIKAFFKDIF